MNRNTSDAGYAPAYPHGSPEEIESDVFMVRGSTKLNSMVRITRNMTVIRHKGELTLVNPIRLSREGEAQLVMLGNVKHILRLGFLHGLDDRYYVERFKAQLWSQPGGLKYPLPPVQNELHEESEMPFPNASLFCFKDTLQPESALLIKRGNGLLITCDAIQHYGDYKYNNFLARIMLPLMGFRQTTLIGPIWLRMVTPEGASLDPEFGRLLSLDFDALVSAHGSFLATGAKAGVRNARARAFAE